MKLKLFLSAVLILGLVSARAATETAAAPTTPAATAGSNAAPTDAMTALFGDPVVAKGKGFEVKRSELDQVVTAAKANAAAAGQNLPPGFEVQILNQLIYIQVLQQLATDADRAEGKQEAQIQFTNIVKHFGSEEAFQRQLKAVNMTVDQLLSKAILEATAKAALRRELNVNITDAEALGYYTNHPSDFEQPELVHARHLLLLTIDPSTHQPLPADQIAAKRKQIDDLRKRLLAGEDFATLAKQYSEDPGSKDEGGELSPFPRVQPADQSGQRSGDNGIWFSFDQGDRQDAGEEAGACDGLGRFEEDAGPATDGQAGAALYREVEEVLQRGDC
jgi:parvulin-like peptidyl-prolyl isomerase